VALGDEMDQQRRGGERQEGKDQSAQGGEHVVRTSAARVNRSTASGHQKSVA
jgi:hypothetical protein